MKTTIKAPPVKQIAKKSNIDFAYCSYNISAIRYNNFFFSIDWRDNTNSATSLFFFISFSIHWGTTSSENSTGYTKRSIWKIINNRNFVWVIFLLSKCARCASLVSRILSYDNCSVVLRC